MSASQQCLARGFARACYLLVLALSLAGAEVRAQDVARVSTDCDTEDVAAHVDEQFRIYGPRSDKYEFFGFIYRVEGEIGSAVVRSNVCRGPDGCKIDIGPAAKRIPRRAKVLGEWHTHSHLNGSRILSIEDVRGANHNLHIRCYAAWYAGPGGEIYRWDPRSTSVPTAMATRVTVGNYRVDAELRVVAPFLVTSGGEPSRQ